MAVPIAVTTHYTQARTRSVRHRTLDLAMYGISAWVIVSTYLADRAVRERSCS
jgi:hypothetical protein